MRQFRHAVTGEVMNVYDGQSVLGVLIASPSWVEVTAETESEPEAESGPELGPAKSSKRTRK